MSDQRYDRGDRVLYEVAKRDGTSFAWPATVVHDNGRRVLIAYEHWADGRRVQSSVRRHRVSLAERA